ncbi:MAG: replicative helicase [Chloroflexota bacterium]|nr:replicative helicase [Chloroflexota bacterium]
MTFQPRIQPTGDTPPQNLQAEAAVLGACLVSAEAMERVSDILRPEFFYKPANGYIFRACIELAKRSQPVDIITVRDELQKLALLEQAGATEYLLELESGAGIPANVEAHAEVIEEAWVRREMLNSARHIKELGSNYEVEIGVALSRAEEAIFRLATQRTPDEPVSLSTLLSEQWDEIEHRHENPGSAMGVPSGFYQLDEMTGGFQDSQLIILAARPGVGKTSMALGIAQHVAVKEKLPVAVFSLEMSRHDLTQRLLCAEAQVDSKLLRTGKLSETDWAKIANAMGALSEGQLFIDDRAALTILELRARSRRLKARYDIQLVVVDYLQLMYGSTRAENRNQEVSEISRGLKALAKEIQVPVIALSQLSRAPEQRGDRKPQLSDLRESGCLTGDSRVYLPDAGLYRPIKDLVGLQGFNVLAVNTETWKLELAPVTHAFATGVKAVSEIRTKTGRTVRATANHKFLTIDGWRRLDELSSGDRIAVPRWLSGPEEPTMSDAELGLLGHLIGDGCTLPRHSIQYTTREMDLAETVAGLASEVFGDTVRPRIHPERSWVQVYLAASARLTHRVRNPIAAWLDDMGVFGLRSHEKFVPGRVFQQPIGGVVTFLRHLWATDGCVSSLTGIYYATSSRRLAGDVQSLLLRLGINAVLITSSQGDKGRDQYHVVVMGKAERERFLSLIGGVNTRRQIRCAEVLVDSAKTKSNTNRDVIPSSAWTTYAVPAFAAAGLTHREFQQALGSRYSGNGLYRQNLGRGRAQRAAIAAGSPELLKLSESDVYWDRIVAITDLGREEVFDLTVDGLHNFVVQDIISHNSIEQDADLVMFIYREGLHNEEVKRNKTELMVAKHRNGPIGDVPLLFLESQTRFVNVTRQPGGMDH